MMMVYIPVDMVRSILRHVPAESLLRFKLVCKQWRSMINNNPLLPKPDMLFITIRGDSVLNEYAIALGSLSSSSSETIYAKKINTPETFLPQISPSFCNGFLLRRDFYKRDWAVWNPFSGEQMDIQLPEDCTRLEKMGLGYDVEANDFKVVRIYQESNVNRKRTSIYSVKSRTWKHIEDFPGGHASNGVFANGLLYFLNMGGGPEVVVSLDLSTEAHSKLPLPKCNGRVIWMLHSLDGRLFLSYDRLDHSLWSLWILQDFEKGNGKWNKLISFSSAESTMSSMTPVAYLKSKAQIVVSYDDRFAWFDLKNNKCIKEVTVEAGFRVTAARVVLNGSASLGWFKGKRGDDLKFKTVERSSWL